MEKKKNIISYNFTLEIDCKCIFYFFSMQVEIFHRYIGAYHLSRMTTNSRFDITSIDNYFHDESLLSVSTMPWFANIVNFFVSGHLSAHWSTQDKRKLLNEVNNFYWDDPYLFKYSPDQIF
jgi:hypothetical protein